MFHTNYILYLYYTYTNFVLIMYTIYKINNIITCNYKYYELYMKIRTYSLTNLQRGRPYLSRIYKFMLKIFKYRIVIGMQ